MPTPNEILPAATPAETPNENLSPFQTYGQYHGNPSHAQLETYFEITGQDRKLIASCRSNITRLGMAVQICTLRFLDTFLEDLSTVPEIVVRHLEQQLDFQNTNFEPYCTSKDARLEHQKLIVKHYGYREFDGAPFLRVTRMLLLDPTAAPSGLGRSQNCPSAMNPRKSWSMRSPANSRVAT
jgi:Domain of unknown function (DUF4158)